MGAKLRQQRFDTAPAHWNAVRPGHRADHGVGHVCGKQAGHHRDDAAYRGRVIAVVSRVGRARIGQDVASVNVRRHSVTAVLVGACTSLFTAIRPATEIAAAAPITHRTPISSARMPALSMAASNTAA